ncbi:DUF885 domain-containing protein [Blautia sp. MSJ-36]|uniref:DUF885 domain-containing protein n=1 Tax=Blautia sp. MSJ-36 TaxID=2841530 RepID=UPI0020A14A47|nr:DUF885 domain-containing protein [Blautia sp. MSJ-36]
MPFKIRGKKSPLFITLLLVLTLFAGLTAGYFSAHGITENGKFEAFSRKVFQNEVSGSTLTLHYTLTHPEKQGIPRKKASLGTVPTDMKNTYQICSQYEEKLKSFRYSRLSTENQLTLDSMLLYYHTEKSLGDNYLLQEPLGPSLGIQAQLPVLLAEYAFYEDQDITDYLNLLTTIRPYFQSILKFEKKKSEAGFFMSDTTLDRVLAQCSAFIQNPDNNYMLDIFQKKLSDYGKLSVSEQNALILTHKSLMKTEVIPAYQELMTGLEALRGTGKNNRGLTYFKGGKAYYLYLLQSQTGSYVPVKQMEKRLSRQLSSEIGIAGTMLRKNPKLLTTLNRGINFREMKPAQMLNVLQQKIQADFPSLTDVTFELRTVHDSMKDYLSPAFYLTPPMDTGTPNVIYINPAANYQGLELFTTLAHEGFPGHLYQTVTFQRQNPSGIRNLLCTSGFAEGWATYVEPFAYQYAADYIQDPFATELARISWLNRSINLCMYSLLDIEIHYNGWTQAEAASFLKAFGIEDSTVVSEIYQYILETPGNYLKYYWGYLSILDLRTSEQNRLGQDFDLKKFHSQVLKIGGVQYPVLEKYIDAEF